MRAAVSVMDLWWSVLSLCFLVALCVHTLSSLLPARLRSARIYELFQDLIRYGKTKQVLRRTRSLDVPKRWFWHFYAVSVLWNGFLLLLYLNWICQRQPLPSWLTGLLEAVTPGSDPAADPQLSTLLLQLLLWVQSLRRLLECLCVSVFSDGVLHLVQYVFGLVYYVTLGLTVLCTDRLGSGSGPLLAQLDWFHVAGTALFIVGSVVQHQSIVLLARLRTGNSGSVQTLAHRLPEGGLFGLVSCPHYFAELLIYVSLSLLAGGRSVTWWLVVLYVLFNQALAAQLCHELYRSKYEAYPRSRKAFIPFVM